MWTDLLVVVSASVVGAAIGIVAAMAFFQLTERPGESSKDAPESRRGENQGSQS